MLSPASPAPVAQGNHALGQVDTAGADGRSQTRICAPRDADQQPQPPMPAEGGEMRRARRPVGGEIVAQDHRRSAGQAGDGGDDITQLGRFYHEDAGGKRQALPTSGPGPGAPYCAAFEAGCEAC